MTTTTKPGKKIEIEIGNDLVLEFRVTLVHYNAFINDMQMTSKVTPATMLLKSTIVKDDADKVNKLNELIESGYAIELATEVVAGFKPDLEIRLKK